MQASCPDGTNSRLLFDWPAEKSYRHLRCFDHFHAGFVDTRIVLCYDIQSTIFSSASPAAFVQIIYNASSTSRSLDTLPAMPTRNKTRTARAARAAKKRSDSGSTPPTPKTGSSDGAVSTSKANKSVRNFNSAPKEGEAKGAPSVTISDVSADNASVKSGGSNAWEKPPHIGGPPANKAHTQQMPQSLDADRMLSEQFAKQEQDAVMLQNKSTARNRTNASDSESVKSDETLDGNQVQLTTLLAQSRTHQWVGRHTQMKFDASGDSPAGFYIGKVFAWLPDGKFAVVYGDESIEFYSEHVISSQLCLVEDPSHPYYMDGPSQPVQLEARPNGPPAFNHGRFRPGLTLPELDEIDMNSETSGNGTTRPTRAGRQGIRANVPPFAPSRPLHGPNGGVAHPLNQPGRDDMRAASGGRFAAGFGKYCDRAGNYYHNAASSAMCQGSSPCTRRSLTPVAITRSGRTARQLTVRLQ